MEETYVIGEGVKLMTEHLEGDYGITELSQAYEAPPPIEAPGYPCGEPDRREVAN